MEHLSNEVMVKIASVVSDEKFAVVKNGVAYHLLSNEVIPSEHIMHQRIHPDGYYRLSEATCGGGKQNDCFVGRPSPTCDSFAPSKCGVYSLYSVKDLKLSLEQVLELMNQP